jgi:hypothetical protein
MSWRESRRAGPPEPRRPAAPRRTLAADLLAAVQAQDFGRTADQWHGGAAVTHFPSIDLAVAAFPANAPPRFANVLFSREHPQGVMAHIGPAAGAVQNVHFDADVQDAKGHSIAWQAGRHWKQLAWKPLLQPHAAQGPTRFVAPYPASLLKLMVAVGVGLAIDRGLLAAWPDEVGPMIVVSDNDATTTCVALLHQLGLVDALNASFRQLGLATLQLNNTTPAGGWRNADGSGVGHIHMTAWDTVRLLWLLDAAAPPPPWLPAGTTLLSDASRAHLHGVLKRQQLDQVLSSGSLRGQPGWVAGLPDAPAFAHKTGTTDNYASDAGIVQAGRTHYIVALLSSLGQRYAPHEACATTWRVPALGAAVHRLMETLA